MAIKSYKPTTNGRRNMTVLVYKNEITCDTPEKSLLAPLAKNGGRKSISYEELEPAYQIDEHGGVFVHYLEQLAMDLKERENN